MNGDYKYGKVLRYDFGPDKKEPIYSFLEGDLTNCYSSKVERYTRSFLFINNKNNLNPGTFIVMDRITSSDPSYKKYFLLHSIQKPQLNNNVITIVRNNSDYNGKLINTTLLPKNINIQTIGGDGNEFNVFGANFPYSIDTTLAEPYEAGNWRVQISPSLENKSDTFLNVMQIMDANQSIDYKVNSTDFIDFTSVNLKNYLVFYIKNNGSNKIKFQINLNRLQLSNNVNLIFPDLPYGKWNVKVDNKVMVKNKIINKDNGVLFLKSKTGIITLEKSY